jgi:hypothetical protein
MKLVNFLFPSRNLSFEFFRRESFAPSAENRKCEAILGS